MKKGRSKKEREREILCKRYNVEVEINEMERPT